MVATPASPKSCTDAPWIYECWESADGTEISFGGANPGLTERDAVIGFHARYSVRAWSWEEAMQAHHEIQGWEPYKPM